MNALLVAPRRWDQEFRTWVRTHTSDVLRLTMAVVFVWFGALKLFPGMSPAEDLAGRTIEALTFGAMSPFVAVKFLAVFECAIGFGLALGRGTRWVVGAMLLHMAGTLTPLVLFPAETWVHAPIQPTMLGQYILKNQVFVGAALVLWSGTGSEQRDHVALDRLNDQ